MPLGTKVGLGSGDIVLDKDPASPQKGVAPTFRPTYCGQSAGCHLEVGLGPGHTVLDGEPPTPNGHSPNFRPMSVVAERLNGSRCHSVRR